MTLESDLYYHMQHDRKPSEVIKQLRQKYHIKDREVLMVLERWENKNLLAGGSLYNSWLVDPSVPFDKI